MSGPLSYRQDSTCHPFHMYYVAVVVFLCSYVRTTLVDAYFCSCRHHGRICKISSAKRFGEFQPRRHGIGGTTGMDSEIWVRMILDYVLAWKIVLTG